MANKLIYLVFLQFVCGIMCQSDKRNDLSYPIDCRVNDTYPWFEGCNRYLECQSNGKAILKNCEPPTKPDEKLKDVCPQSEDINRECGYSGCTTDTTDLVGFNSPNASVTATPYYAMCIKGIIVRQSKCRTDDPDLTPIFDSKDKVCTFSCEDGYVIPINNCTAYRECVDNKLIETKCPPGSLYDGITCNFAKATC